MLSPTQILKHGNFKNIMVFIVLYALAFFVALTVSTTLAITVRAIVPHQTNALADAWITLGIAFLLFAIVVYILINVMDNDSTYKYE